MMVRSSNALSATVVSVLLSSMFPLQHATEGVVLSIQPAVNACTGLTTKCNRKKIDSMVPYVIGSCPASFLYHPFTLTINKAFC